MLFLFCMKYFVELKMQYSGMILRPSWIYFSLLWIFGMLLLVDNTHGTVPDPCAVRDSTGTEFVVGFLKAMSDGESPHIYIVGSSRRSTTVNIYTSLGNSTLDITHYNPVKVVDLMKPQIPGSEAILVTADHEVSVYGIDRGNSIDSFLALPTDALGREYYVVSYHVHTRVQRDSRGSQFMVMGAHDRTEVRIRLNGSATCGGIPQPGQTNILMIINKLETIYCISQDNDLTGSHVLANKPVALLSGSKCAMVPRGERYCDHLVEQLPPVSSWETRFITAPLKDRAYGDIFRVIAARNRTTVRTSINRNFTLNAGQFVELQVGSNVSAAIVSDKPILVMQYSKGGNIDGTSADPFMMLVPAVDQFLSEAMVAPISTSTGVGHSLTNHINVIMDCSAKKNLYHGIFHFPQESFRNAPDITEELLHRRYCVTQKTISSAPYFLEDRVTEFNSFTVLIYGYFSGHGNEAYGMPAGLTLRNNSCPRPPMRISSTAPPRNRIVCPTLGPRRLQLSTSRFNLDNNLAPKYPKDPTINSVNTIPTSGSNVNNYPTSKGNDYTVAIIVGMFSVVIIIILLIYIYVLRRRIQRLEAERKAYGQLQMSHMLVGPDGYIDLDGSQIPQRDYMPLNNTDGVWRVGKVRRVDRAMFRSMSGANGMSNGGAANQYNQPSKKESSFRERRLPSSESAPQDLASVARLNRQLSTTESCGGVSHGNGSTAALIPISRQGSICEEPVNQSIPEFQPIAASRSSSRHASIHLESDPHPDVVPSRRKRKQLWRSVSNPGVNPMTNTDLKVYYEVPRNNRPLTTGTVSSTYQHYDRPRRRTNSDEISPIASVCLTQFPNSLPPRQDDGYMSMKDPRASVSSQASGSQQGDISQTSASTGISMLDKAYASIPDENFNNANDAGDTDSTDYTELY